MAGTVHVSVGGNDELATLRGTYLSALEAGARELIVDLEGCFGLDPPGMPASLELAPVNAKGSPAIAVTLRCTTGLCVLAGIPVRIAARRVTVEGVAVVGSPGAAIAVTVSEGVELRRVIVLGNRGDDYSRAAVDLGAAGTSGTRARIEQTVIAHNTAPDATLGLYGAAGAWFDEAHFEKMIVTGSNAEALIAIDAVRLLRAERCDLLAGASRTVLRLGWPIPDGEIAACRISTGRGALLTVQGTTPTEPPKLRLTGKTTVTSPLDRLPATVAADATVTAEAAETIDAAIEQMVAAAASQVLAVDARLAPLLA